MAQAELEEAVRQGIKNSENIQDLKTIGYAFVSSVIAALVAAIGILWKTNSSSQKAIYEALAKQGDMRKEFQSEVVSLHTKGLENSIRTTAVLEALAPEVKSLVSKVDTLLIHTTPGKAGSG